MSSKVRETNIKEFPEERKGRKCWKIYRIWLKNPEQFSAFIKHFRRKTSMGEKGVFTWCVTEWSLHNIKEIRWRGVKTKGTKKSNGRLNLGWEWVVRKATVRNHKNSIFGVTKCMKRGPKTSKKFHFPINFSTSTSRSTSKSHYSNERLILRKPFFSTINSWISLPFSTFWHFLSSLLPFIRWDIFHLHLLGK